MLLFPAKSSTSEKIKKEIEKQFLLKKNIHIPQYTVIVLNLKVKVSDVRY